MPRFRITNLTNGLLVLPSTIGGSLGPHKAKEMDIPASKVDNEEFATFARSASASVVTIGLSSSVPDAVEIPTASAFPTEDQVGSGALPISLDASGGGDDLMTWTHNRGVKPIGLMLFDADQGFTATAVNVNAISDNEITCQNVSGVQKNLILVVKWDINDPGLATAENSGYIPADSSSIVYEAGLVP